MAKYFKESEFCCKHCGQLPAGGVDEKLIRVLDAMRAMVNKPLIISSGYRCPVHNANVGGVRNSFHVQGCAADVLLPDGVTVDELADIAEKCGADGIGRYYDQEFVHVDTRGYVARW